MCQAALARGRVGGGEGVGGVRGSWLRKGGCVMCNLWGGMRMIYVYIYLSAIVLTQPIWVLKVGVNQGYKFTSLKFFTV